MKFCKGCRSTKHVNQFQDNRAQCLTCRKKMNTSLALTTKFEAGSVALHNYAQTRIKEWLKTDPQSRINESLLPKGNQ